MELYLIRHPRVDVAPGTCYGASDVLLAEDAVEAARRLLPLLPEACAVVSSPLSRCRKLAEALSSRVSIEPRFSEMDFGEWEMQHFDRIGREAVDAWATDPFGFRPPGGESARDMSRRVLAALGEIPASMKNGPLVIVAHGGPLRVIAGHLLNLPEKNWMCFDFAPGQMSCLDVSEGAVLLKCFNRG